MRWTPDQTLFLDAGPARLEARCWGPPPGDAATLVLLHEGLGCVDLWRDFPARLAAATGLGVFAWSRAGYGRSDPCALPRPLDYMEQEAAVLPGLLDSAGIGDRILVGHSDGGSIAALAGSHPSIRGLVLMAPHFRVEDCSITAIAQARADYGQGLRDRLAKYHQDPDTAFRGWNDSWLDPGFRDWDITACLGRIEAPVLAIQGADDPYGTPWQVEIIPERCSAPVDVHLLPDCGHAPHLEQAERTLDLITGFVRGLA